MAALLAGEPNPKTLAELARGQLRCKIGALEEAFTGYFTDHHDAMIEELIAPFATAVNRLDEIPGIARTAAAAILAEIGTDMSRFPTPAHLASWARFAPGVSESAGKLKGRGSTGHGNRYLARILGEAAVTAGRGDTFLGERYRRIARRRCALRRARQPEPLRHPLPRRLGQEG